MWVQTMLSTPWPPLLGGIEEMGLRDTLRLPAASRCTISGESLCYHESAMMDKLVEGARQLGLPLTEHQLQQFQTYYEQLVDWNSRVNLTGITDYEEVQVKHFVDSLSIVLALEGAKWADGNFALLDIGTGAGMPGIPLKIVCPRAKLRSPGFRSQEDGLSPAYCGSNWDWRK